MCRGHERLVVDRHTGDGLVGVRNRDGVGRAVADGDQRRVGVVVLPGRGVRQRAAGEEGAVVCVDRAEVPLREGVVQAGPRPTGVGRAVESVAGGGRVRARPDDV